jgi:HK97 family phage portal protein
MSRLRPLLRSVIGSTEAYNSLVKAFQNQGAWGLLAILDQEGKAMDLNKEQRSIIKAKFKADAKKGDLSIVSNQALWTPVGLTMVEMELLKAFGLYKGNLCDAYNVPSQLLAGSQDRTYNNFKEAEAALWRNAIQPSLDAYLEGLTNWLAPLFGEEGTFLRADYSNVACLQTNNVELVSWMTTARAFTKNEIREALGYEELDDPAMDMIYEGAGLMPLGELGLPPDTEATEENLKDIPDYRQ